MIIAAAVLIAIIIALFVLSLSQKRCPNCGSLKTEKMPDRIFQHSWVCRDCQNVFNPKER